MTADRNLAIFQLIVIVIGEVLICAIMNGQGLSSIIIRGPVVTRLSLGLSLDSGQQFFGVSSVANVMNRKLLQGPKTGFTGLEN